MTLRILIIDDNAAIHADFIKILTTNSIEENRLNNFEKQVFGESNNPIASTSLPEFQIDTALQGQEGVEKIAQAIKEGSPYALAFVDIRMPPGWDGVETTKRIWKLDPDIQVVICTAYSDYTWEETVEQLGQRENLLILKKPFDNIAVRQLSCALTKKWQLLQQSREYTSSLEQQVKERTQSLQESLSVTRGTLESAADAIIVVNKENGIIDYNNNLVQMFNIPESILETTDSNLLFEYLAAQFDNSDDFLKMMREISEQTNVVKIGKLKCNDSRFFEHYTQPYKLEDAVAGRIWSFRDITQRAILEERMHYQATHDTLTQLPNRALLNDRLHQTILRAKRDYSNFSILFFDIDRFKLVNDSFNHQIGDHLLKEVAARLKHAIREGDTLARLGGDEFVAILQNLEGNDAAKVASKLLNVFNAPFKIDQYEFLVTSSIGIAVYPQDAENCDELLRNADTAMYRSKENGGNQFQFYTKELGEQSLKRLKLENDLRKAIENKEFFLCYQPQFDLKTKKLMSAEALIRWKHPTRGEILPIHFIPLAEETGLIVPIGEWVLREVCRQNKQWQDEGLPKIRIAVNISTKQIKQLNLSRIVENILKETQLEPQYLEFEITENVMISNLESTNVMRQLKELGVSFALDDFGSGYSSLNHLRIFPVDRLKIDQSFIRNINMNRGDEVIIQAIITLANNLKLDVLAEGVESKEQLDFLKSNQCDEIQGFYFSMPLIRKDFESFLKNVDSKNPAGDKPL